MATHHKQQLVASTNVIPRNRWGDSSGLNNPLLVTVWSAACYGHKKLQKKQILDTDIREAANRVIEYISSSDPSLRISGGLLVGVTRLYSKRIEYFEMDCREVYNRMQQATLSIQPSSGQRKRSNSTLARTAASVRAKRQSGNISSCHNNELLLNDGLLQSMDLDFDILADFERQEQIDASVLERITREVVEFDPLSDGLINIQNGEECYEGDEELYGNNIMRSGEPKNRRRRKVIRRGYKYDLLNDDTEEDTNKENKKKERCQRDELFDKNEQNNELEFGEEFRNENELLEELGIVLERNDEEMVIPGPIERLRGDPSGMDDENEIVSDLNDLMMTNARGLIATARRKEGEESEQESSRRDSINTELIESPDMIGRNSIGCNSIMIEEPYSLSPMDDGHDECLVSLDGLFESERRNSVLSNETRLSRLSLSGNEALEMQDENRDVDDKSNDSTIMSRSSDLRRIPNPLLINNDEVDSADGNCVNDVVQYSPTQREDEHVHIGKDSIERTNGNDEMIIGYNNTIAGDIILREDKHGESIVPESIDNQLIAMDEQQQNVEYRGLNNSCRIDVEPTMPDRTIREWQLNREPILNFRHRNSRSSILLWSLPVIPPTRVLYSDEENGESEPVQSDLRRLKNQNFMHSCELYGRLNWNFTRDEYRKRKRFEEFSNAHQCQSILSHRKPIARNRQRDLDSSLEQELIPQRSQRRRGRSSEAINELLDDISIDELHEEMNIIESNELISNEVQRQNVSDPHQPVIDDFSVDLQLNQIQESQTQEQNNDINNQFHHPGFVPPPSEKTRRKESFVFQDNYEDDGDGDNTPIQSEVSSTAVDTESNEFTEVFSIVHGDFKSRRKTCNNNSDYNNYDISKDLRERTPFKTPFSKLRQRQRQCLESLESINEASLSATPLRSTPIRSCINIENGQKGIEIIDRTPIRRQPPGVDLYCMKSARRMKSGRQNYTLPTSLKVRQTLEQQIGFSKRTVKMLECVGSRLSKSQTCVSWNEVIRKQREFERKNVTEILRRGKLKENNRSIELEDFEAPDEGNDNKNVMSFNALVEGQKRDVVAALVFELLALKSRQFIDLAKVPIQSHDDTLMTYDILVTTAVCYESLLEMESLS